VIVRKAQASRKPGTPRNSRYSILDAREFRKAREDQENRPAPCISVKGELENSPFRKTSSKQAQLLVVSLGLGEIIYSEFRTPLVQPELFAGDLETPPYHPGDRTRPLHARAPL
jgi:hypothetical protein